MKFDAWMVASGRTNASFAKVELKGEASTETVRRLRLPPGDPLHRLPTRRIAALILAGTGGLVTPNDFYDLGALVAGASGDSQTGVAA